MTNHYHLLIETPDANLAAGMHLLNGTCARRFNWRHGFKGHLFQARFHSKLVQTEAHLLEVLRYIPLNPIRAGLCSDASDWRWSSYGAAMGNVLPPPFLTPAWELADFAPTLARARAAFEQFVREAPGKTAS